MRQLFTLLSALLLSACASTTVEHIQIDQPSHFASFENHGAEAGAATVDLTPPPGMPMGGYSVMANKGQGYRTRIKARVLYLRDQQGEAMALVQGDLTAASLLVHHLVAAKVAQSTGLKPSQIAFTASHSHSSPVNFFDNDFYNKHTSSGEWLETNYLSFTVEQISQAIEQAFASRRPAKVATGVKEVYGLNRNRAIDSYVLNETVKDISLKDQDAKLKAVNPNLYMLRVDVQDDLGQFKPLAAFSSFSVHNTAIGVPVTVYNADLFGFAQRDLEWAIADQYHTPWPVVSALTNGTHADMAPNLKDNGDNWISYMPLDWKATSELGHKLGAASIALFKQLDASLTADISLGSAARELNIREHNKIDEIEICKDAAVGSPVAAGAYERRTPWLTLMPFFHGGNFMTRRSFFTSGCQGNKQHLGFAYLQPLLEPKDSFPNTVMFQVLRVNDMVILPLPFEVTVEAGRRISAAVSDVFAEAGQAPKYTWVASVSNGYFGYSTTPEEYSRQNYEGGHTIYGKNNTPYLAAQLKSLTQDYLQHGAILELKPEWHYKLKTARFYPKDSRASGQREVLEQPSLVAAKKATDEDYVAFNWLDLNASEIQWHNPLVKLQQRQGDDWVDLVINGNRINDEGYDLEVRHLKSKEDGMDSYQARWYNPVAGDEYRFVIEARANQAVLYSQSFALSSQQGVSLLH
ncbi:MAG: neutral/alkaline non-lysosomal ceramidase N-terminal domain-containing protein [Venatoribacter sp.]